MKRQYINAFNYLRVQLFVSLWFICFILCAKYSFAHELAVDKATYQTRADSTRFNITGRVIDETGEPLPGATVFISNSKWAASTDNKGMFKITEIPAGNYEVLVRMMGFSTFTKVFNITDRSVTINVTLNPDAIALSEAKIVAKPDGNRARYLKTFTEVFVGQSGNANKSKILNSDVIRFEYIKATGTLTARSTDFIKIENSGLGYNIYYLLNSFAFNQQDGTFAYDGKIFFEELPGDEKKQKDWSKNRVAAFYGSMQHFFRSLSAGTTDAEGFKVYKIADAELGQTPNYNSTRSARMGISINRINIDRANLKPIKPDSLFKTAGYNKVLKLPLLVKNGDTTRFYVCYMNQREPTRFVSSGAHLNIPVQNAQISRIFQLADNIILNKNGTLSSQQSIMIEGFWGWLRVGDLLPEEFLPTGDVNTQKALAKQTDLPIEQPLTEKIHLQMDRPWYLAGDTAWMKIYVVDANNKPLNDNKTCFIELIDEKKRIIKNLRLPLENGVAWGDFTLSDSLVKKGSYLIRVYTNTTQKNGNPFFYQTLRVTDLNSSPAKIKRTATTLQQWALVADSLKLQFFPEGGSLVTDVNSRVALMINAAGKPVNKMPGYIADEVGSHIAKFETNSFGISTFNLKPQRNGKYWAVLTLPNGKEKRFALPQALSTGIVMGVKQTDDDIVVHLKAGNINSKIALNLVVKANGGVQYQAEKLMDPTGDSIVVSKTELPSGTLQFNFYTNDNTLVAERMVYNQNDKQQLKVKLTPNKSVYKPHDKIDLNIAITDADGRPVSGNFSVSVNNEADVPDINNKTILTDLLPADKLNYDVAKLNTGAYQELDDLMLTVKLQNGNKLPLPQQALTNMPQDSSVALQGQVYTAKGRPAEPSVVGIFFPLGGPVLTSISDSNGRFRFKSIPVKRGDPFYIVAKEKNGKDLNVTVDTYTPPPITDEIMADTLKSNDTIEYMDYVAKRIEELKTGNIFGTALKEVQIKEKKKVEPTLKELVLQRSSNIGGRPDQVLTFIDLLGCTGASLAECLALKLNGVTVTVDTLHHSTRLFAKGRSTSPMAVYVDGIERPEALTQLTGSAVASVEVLKGSNAAAYGFNSGNGVVVVTTKNGELDYWAYEQEHYVPGSSKTPAIQRYRFENSFDIARDFYAPDYNTTTGNIIDKWRPTIYWNPNVVTGTNGTAQLSYFTNGVPGKYRITIEGIDDNGRIARQVFSYTISE